MEIKSFSELINIANEKADDIEKLEIIQKYFLENVEFDYIQELATEKKEYFSNKCYFDSEQEKEEEIVKLEKSFGKNFTFSQSDKVALFNLLGKKVEPSNKLCKFGEKEYTINIPGYDGSLYDCIKQVGVGSPIYENGLIKKGMCNTFSRFLKEYCDCLGIDCRIAGTGVHDFCLINIDGEVRVFDPARMIGVRDDYKNPNGEIINDWWNISPEKMYELKPNDRNIQTINEVLLDEEITNLNYKEKINKIFNIHGMKL